MNLQKAIVKTTVALLLLASCRDLIAASSAERNFPPKKDRKAPLRF